MLQMAQLLAGSEPEGPRKHFVDTLEHRIRSKRAGSVSRRTAVVSGIGALAAGVLAGVGLDNAFSQSGEPYATALVGRNGFWADVMDQAELPEGAVKPFTAGAVSGFLLRKNGQISALSGVCTHMGCLLRYSRTLSGFVCPCHGAEFDLSGGLRSYPHHLMASLPSLPWLEVRVKDGSVQVWTA
jgi:nitrite reductase/ring-hydroxylating ferredoxin subunit